MTKHMIATGHTVNGDLVVKSAESVQYRVCAWCNQPLDPPTHPVLDGSPMAGTTTHGMCAACKRNWDAKLVAMAAAKAKP